jgi:flagellar motor switch protein FliN/FliY
MSEETMPGAERASVRPVQLEEVKGGAESARPLADSSLDLVQDVKVRLTMSVGGAQLSIGELYALKEGAVLKLDKATSDPIDIFLDARLVARGELMVAGDHFAIRITEIGGKA